jgi:hypothetical protein
MHCGSVLGPKSLAADGAELYSQAWQPRDGEVKSFVMCKIDDTLLA